MDPDVVYAAIYKAMAGENYAQARVHTINLKKWFANGGFYPQKSPPDEVDNYLTAVLQRTEPIIRPFRADWLAFIKVIDIKGCDWPWCDDKWKDISKYIIRILWIGSIKGFSVFRFDTEGLIWISKLIADQNKDMLLVDIENTARKHGIIELKTVVWEHDDNQIQWLGSYGFEAIGLSQKFPDGSDGYIFRKVIADGC